MIKWIKEKFLQIYVNIINARKGLKPRIIDGLNELKKALSQETKETKYMVDVYRRFSIGQASRAEMKMANSQFRDLIRGAGLGVFLFLPFAPLTIPFIVGMGKKLGIEVLPSSLRDSDTLQSKNASEQ